MSVLFLTPDVPVRRSNRSRLREALLVSAPSYIAPKYKLYCSEAEPILVGAPSNSAWRWEVVIKSGDFGSFKLVPLTEDDTLMSKEEFFAKIDRAIERVRAGQYTEVSTKEELTAFLDSL